jgi:hypothetical protein
MRRIGAKLEVQVTKIPKPFPESVHAFTLWPFIVYEPQVWDDACVQIHERYHWNDQARWLVLPWLLAYLVLRPFYGGGRRHPLEREAYRRGDACGDVPD